ncbi:STAS domain-containing protein [Streptomyces sp. NPDC005202]|uniref:STAS domain-containing protein n=1 Tax=Streptomyces sp. NPDC005202 TaxID=3157021 RepID=UPI0033AA5A83
MWSGPTANWTSRPCRPAFAHTLADARSGIGRRFLIIDLSDVTFVDGSALGPLLAAWEDCRARHGWARVVHGRSGVGRMLWASGVLRRFPRYATAQDAWHGIPSVPGPWRSGSR